MKLWLLFLSAGQLDRKQGGKLIGPSAYCYKHPLKQFADDEA
jgi:hypothetical protein